MWWPGGNGDVAALLQPLIPGDAHARRTATSLLGRPGASPRSGGGRRGLPGPARLRSQGVGDEFAVTRGGIAAEPHICALAGVAGPERRYGCCPGRGGGGPGG